MAQVGCRQRRSRPAVTSGWAQAAVVLAGVLVSAAYMVARASRWVTRTEERLTRMEERLCEISRSLRPWDARRRRARGDD